MPPRYPYTNAYRASTSQARRWAVITPDDNTGLAFLPRALRCNGAGNLVLVGGDGVAVTFTVAAGELLPFQPTRVKATGTTATGIVARLFGFGLSLPEIAARTRPPPDLAPLTDD